VGVTRIESKSSFLAKNRIEIDRKSKFGNRNITTQKLSIQYSSLSILYSKQRYGHRSTSLTPI